MVQQLRRVQPERQVSQKAERAQTAFQKKRDVLDFFKGEELFCENDCAQDRARHNKKTISSCPLLEEQRHHLLALKE